MNPSENREPPDPPTRSPRRSFRRRLLAYLVLTSCVSALLCAIFWRPLFRENLAAVDRRVFRSAQPTAHLGDWIREYHLASILNLRGGTPADDWYNDEVRTSASNGVAFFDYPMLATRRPSRRDLLTIVDFLRTCPYPLLIHCKHGADRTGLAVVLYRMVCLDEPPERASDSFSVFFGHIPIAGTQHLHEPIDEYAAWLRENALPHSPDRFRAWIKDQYKSEDRSINPPPLASGPRPFASR